MIAVAAVALLISGGILWDRSVKYRGQATQYAGLEKLAREDVLRTEQRVARFADRPDDPRHERWAKELARSRAQVTYFGALRRKYGRLASRPWETSTPAQLSAAGTPAA